MNGPLGGSWILALFLGVATVSGISAAEIKLQRRVASPGSLVLLGDVAQISDASPAEVDALKRVELFPAPGRGESRILRRSEIRELLSLNGVDILHHRLSGAEKIHVAARLRQPVSKPQLEEVPAPQPAPVRWFVVARRKLARGEVLGMRDVERRQQPAGTTLSERAVRDLEDVLDRELTRSLQEGQAIETNMVRRPILIERNQLITVLSRRPGVRVQVTAKAMESGSQDDLITVQALESREKYSARVTGLKQAEVFVGGEVVSRSAPRERRSGPISSRIVRP